MAGDRRPVATYRVQFTPAFGFEAGAGLAAYVRDLGAGAVYASPVWEARRGSPHGYDVTDPTRIRAELGGPAAFQTLAASLKSNRLGLLLDIVPNHMASSTQGPWWNDVLEHGARSEFASFFDIDWEASQSGRLVLPVLGEPRSDALERGLITLVVDEHGLGIRYYDNRIPVEPGSYANALEGLLHGPEVRRLKTESTQLAGWRHDALHAGAHEEREKAEDLKVRWLRLVAQAGIDKVPLEAPRLAALLALQPYELVFWSDGLARLNYRRFFDISDLAGLRVEDPAVFEAVHRLPLALIRDGTAIGLRIDHIDGLRDPGAYVDQLFHALTNGTSGGTPYLVVEKILDPEEELPESWRVDGTTGYEFLNALNGVFVDAEGLRALQRDFRGLVREPRTFREIAFEKKRIVLNELFGPELEALLARLLALLRRRHGGGPVEASDAAAALLLVTAALPVYRTYFSAAANAPDDRAHVAMALELARKAHDAPDGRVFDLLEGVLLEEGAPGEHEDERLEFVIRWQQLTGPATAKGVEDTALYSYVPLISLNEVGGDPSGDHASLAYFHRHNTRRSSAFSSTLNATSTHDTKRSEDVRARLNVLSEVAPQWLERVERWRAINASVRREENGKPAPSPADELLIYQTLAGVWPLDSAALAGVEQRVAAFMIKACREAKERSSWLAPNADYEDAVAGFVHEILNGGTSGEFAASFLPFQASIAQPGASNSLAQVVLKVASPGVPDFYQGSETWDFSLTDPDNRRPVAYVRLRSQLSALAGARDRAALLTDLLGGWQDGRIKLFATHQLLLARAAQPDIFAGGDYLPLGVEGPQAKHVCGFARRHAGRWVIAVAPRLVTRLSLTGGWPLGEAAWADTKLALPPGSPVRWEDIFSGTALQIGENGTYLRLADILASFPVALLTGSQGGQP